MNCRKIEIMLSDWLDNDPDHFPKQVVQQHMKTCVKCRTGYEALRSYSEIVTRIDRLKAPEGLHGKIMQRVNDLSPGRTPLVQPYLILSVKAVAVAAILLLVLYLVVPESYYQPSHYQVDYSLRVKKMGKGPSISQENRIAASVQFQNIMDLANRFNASIIKDGYNESSGLTDFVTLRLKKDSVKGFRRQYNLNRGADTLPVMTSKGFSKYVDIQVFFPGRRLVSCDINGDRYKDIIVYFSQGRFAGNWYTVINNKADGFDAPVRVLIDDTLKYLPEQSALLSGDLNGDHFDDLILQLRFGKEAGRWICYLNNRQGGFKSGKLLTFDGNDKAFTGINTPLTGDFNGDGLDDIGVHYRKGEDAGKWIFSINIGNGKFSAGSFLQVNCKGVGQERKYLPFAMDFNGDGLADCGVQWQWGDQVWCGKWFITLNSRNNLFSQERQVFYALCGEYVILTGDFNNDGFDDICAKTGTPDETGEWMIFHNQNGEKFVYVDRKITFGGKPEIKVQ